MQRHVSSYENFRDPLGLVLRMLRSGDRAARSALYRDALQFCLKPLDLLLQPFEARRLRRGQSSTLPVIFIIGSPRSGSTLVYQALARYLPVTYFSNLSALFPRSPISATAVFQPWLAQRRPDFHSYYGNAVGLAAPNDGFPVWNRWLGNDRYSVPGSLSEAGARGMRSFFSAWVSTFDKPFLNKNNRNTFCVELLSSTLDNVHFVEVQRDPLYVAQSLLIAREKVQGSRAIGWGLGATRPRGAAKSPIEDVVEQVAYVYAKIREQKERVGARRFIEISYERFCENPILALQVISTRVLGRDLEESDRIGEIKPFPVNNHVQLSEPDFDHLRARIHEVF